MNVPSGHDEVSNGIQSGDCIYMSKSVKSKKFRKGKSDEVGNGKTSSPEAQNRARKKKSEISYPVNGHGIKSEKLHDTEQKACKDYTVHTNGDMHGSLSQQTDSCLENTLTSCANKNRKRKKKDKKNPDSSSQESLKHVDGRRSKKLKTDKESQSDKTVITTSSIEPGAFENYRISQSMAEKLHCM